MDEKPSETVTFAEPADIGVPAFGTAPAGQEPWAERARKKSAVLIAGMHRSGTSALARILSLLGCELPKTLLPAGLGNELGHWESLPIVNLNDEILASAGSSWDDWEAFNPRWCDSPVKDGFLERALKTLEEEFGASCLFVLKDPRICRLLPFWVEALEAFGTTPHVIYPLRHPMEVAASLERRDGIDPSVGRLLWLRYMLDAEAHSRGLKRAFLRYDSLITGWRSLPDRLGCDLGIAWPRRSSAVEIEIDGFLSAAHRHHAEEDASVLGDPNLSRWIRSSFEIVDRWARGEGHEDDRDELDQIRAAFDEAAPAFARAIAAGRKAARQNAALEGKLAAACSHSAAFEAAATAKEAELARRGAELAESRGRIGELEAVVAAKEAELKRREAELAASQGRIGALESAVETKEAELTQRDHELAETQGRIGWLENTVAAKETELARRAAELVETHARIGDLDAVLTAKETELARRDAELGKTKGRIGWLEGAVAAKETELARRGTELAETQGRIGWLEGAVAAKAAELAQRDAELGKTRGQIGELEESVAAMAAGLAQRDAELGKTHGRIGELESAVAAMAAELEQRGAELTKTQLHIGELRGRVAATETERDRRGAELTNAQGRIGELQSAVAAQEAELGELQQVAAAQEARAGALDRKIAALRQSTSWKVTAPLRGAGLVLKRARYSSVGYPITLGVRALITFSRAPLRDFRAARAITRSGLFDRDWYLETYPDVAALAIDPVRHYVAFGAREGRDPSPLFSTRRYLERHCDVAAKAINPLSHYCLFGRAEGRSLNLPIPPVGLPTRDPRHAPTLTKPPFPSRSSDLPKKFPLPSNISAYLDLCPGLHPEPASVSVIIPTLNAGAEFYWLLRKLVGQEGIGKLEIIIVDSGSTDDTLRLAQQFGCEIVNIEPAEFSHSHARNLGASRAGGDYLVFMVQDAFPVGNYWLASLVAVLQTPHDGSPIAAASCNEFPRTDSEIFYDSLISSHYKFLGSDETDRIGRQNGLDHKSLRSQGQLSDVACILSRTLFGRYGFHGRYAEDLSLGVKLISDGHRIAMLSGVKVIHSHSRPAHYYLRRAFVDCVYLSEVFPDWPIGSTSNLIGIVLGASLVTRAIADALCFTQGMTPGAGLAQITDRLTKIPAPASLESDLRLFSFGMENLDDWARKVLGETERGRTLSQSERSDAVDLIQMVRSRIEHLRLFVSKIYISSDTLIDDELQAGVWKSVAYTLGVKLAYLYMQRRYRAGGFLSEPQAEGLQRIMVSGV